MNNTFEHNIAIACLPASYDDYYNPLPIYPNIASDLAISSAFWLKNNQNKCLRNVICNSPAPVIGLWFVPQNISRLRGHSTICIGDEILRLTALGSSYNAIGNENENIGKYEKIPEIALSRKAMEEFECFFVKQKILKNFGKS